MRTVATVAEVRNCVDQWRAKGEEIALVPTMGALHAGHMRLVDEARKLAPRTVVSLFVNPRQFTPNEDLAAYPSDPQADSAKLAEAGADLLYAPSLDQVYPDGFATTVSVSGPAQGLEGSSRPGFFEGVATVVTKLFTQVLPDVALFGEKDYQQLQVVKRLVRDLDLRPLIVAVPTVREDDGLACSSRNAYLDDEQRRAAPRLYELLSRTAERMASDGDPERLLSEAEAELRASFDKVDYLAWRDGETFGTTMAPGRAGRLLAAVVLGRTRLIDNVPVAPLNMRTKP